MERSLDNAPEDQPYTDPESLIRLMKKDLKNNYVIFICTPYDGELYSIMHKSVWDDRIGTMTLRSEYIDSIDQPCMFINGDGEIEIKRYDIAEQKTKVNIPTNKINNWGGVIIPIDIAQQLLEEIAELTFMEKPQNPVDEWLNS